MGYVLEITVKRSDANYAASGTRFVQSRELFDSEQDAELRKEMVLICADQCGDTAHVSGPSEKFHCPDYPFSEDEDGPDQW